MANLTYSQAVADIVKVSAHGDEQDTQARVMQQCHVMEEFIAQFAIDAGDGYMLMAAFVAAFNQMKKALNSAQGQDRVLIEQLMLATIGSFGKTVQ